jgi:PAS domain S-box-containing protein
VNPRPRLAPALTEAERRLHTIVTKAPVIFFALDAEGVFTLSEGRALQKLGLQPGQVLGQSVFQLYRDQPAILEHVKRALSGEEFSDLDELPELGLSFETHWAPIYGTDGKLAGTIGVAVDISDRAKNEKARYEAETLYRSLVEQLSAVTYIAELGLEGEWLFVSPQIEALLGYSPRNGSPIPQTGSVTCIPTTARSSPQQKKPRWPAMPFALNTVCSGTTAKCCGSTTVDRWCPGPMDGSCCMASYST